MMRGIFRVGSRVGPTMPLRAVCGLVLSVVSMAGWGHRAAGQVTGNPHPQSLATSQRTSQVIAALPQPLVPASFLEPTHPIDWQQYQQWEDCEGQYDRQQKIAQHKASQSLVNDRTVDTSHHDDSFFQPTVFREAHACLLRFRLADVWPGLPDVLDEWRRFAIGMFDDSLLQAIVAKQLAAIPGTAVKARAAVLLSVIRDLSASHALRASPWKARREAYFAQLDGLGPAAWMERLRARDAVVHSDLDIDSVFAIRLEQLQLLQDSEIVQLPEMKQKTTNKEDNVTVREYELIGANTMLKIARYLKTFSRDSLAEILQLNSRFMINDLAPALHCDYFFPTLQAATPRAGPVPALPAKGHFSLLVVNYIIKRNQEDEELNAFLRRIHQKLPTLPIIIESRLTGMFAYRLFGEHHEQEAMFLNRTLSDSLGLSGAFCADTIRLTKNIDGYVLEHASPNQETYHVRWGETAVLFVDPTGTIVGYKDEFPLSSLQDFDTFLMHYMKGKK